MTEAEFRADSPASRWSVTVPVAGREQRHIHAVSYGKQQGLFATARLRIYPDYNGDTAYVLSGPNIRQDGTPGAKIFNRRVDRSHVEEMYPGTLEMAKAALTAGAGHILAAAQAAQDQITAVISGQAL